MLAEAFLEVGGELLLHLDVALTHRGRIEQQEILVGAEPGIFAPVKGGWGRKGWTSVILAAADEAALRSAIVQAWRNVAPPALRRTADSP